MSLYVFCSGIKAHFQDLMLRQNRTELVFLC